MDVIFPDEQQDHFIPNSSSISRCLNELEGLPLNDQQKHAVRSVIDPLYQEVRQEESVDNFVLNMLHVLKYSYMM